jgi:hypothetical protein
LNPPRKIELPTHRLADHIGNVSQLKVRGKYPLCTAVRSGLGMKRERL